MRFPMKIGLFSPLIRVFGGRRDDSYAELKGDELHFKFGAVDLTVPLSDVVDVDGGASWPLIGGIGWRVGPKTLGLIGSLDGIAKLETRSRYPTGVWYLPVKWNSLYISLEDPRGFATAVNAARDPSVN